MGAILILNIEHRMVAVPSVKHGQALLILRGFRFDFIRYAAWLEHLFGIKSSYTNKIKKMGKVTQENLPEGWILIDKESCSKFEKELAREIPKGHVLEGITVKAVARKESRDDFLFHIEHNKYKYADVHLTWSIETDPKWPFTNLHIDYEDWKHEIETDDSY